MAETRGIELWRPDVPEVAVTQGDFDSYVAISGLASILHDIDSRKREQSSPY